MYILINRGVGGLPGGGTTWPPATWPAGHLGDNTMTPAGSGVERVEVLTS
jgi:hypothetical protein